MPECRKQEQGGTNHQRCERNVELYRTEASEEIGQGPEHISQSRNKERAAINSERGEPEGDIQQYHDHGLAKACSAVVEAKQSEDRMHDHRRCEQVKPKGNVRA